MANSEDVVDIHEGAVVTLLSVCFFFPGLGGDVTVCLFFCSFGEP
jgi:hypothetical protein